MLNFVRTDDTLVEPSPVPSLTPSRGEKLDRAGATASFLCAIHCAIMPFIITVLPLLGLGFLSSEPVEWGLLSCSAVLGTLSLCVGFREHKQRRVFGVLGLALALLVAGRIFHEHHLGWWGPIFMVLGGFTMMGAHLLNRLLCRSCSSCSTHGCCH
ncbi:MerC mercury resistance protein [Abditibacterium utsteinense]|uniref:MerC mercury resistance protein n=1 Tax=Abditibacterium utsteinense TaxID=1960156 RepID=A0A2S8SUZ9_9BACT|nr:MerC domain-containing protein [Abditibacterium utsteinense]PQV64604.1 MerC mercury resistance protein [Abditibacterium utsteinense]